MYARFLQYASNNRLLDGRHHILLAVSGGADSVVLLNLFKRAAKTEFKTLKFSVAHCNFHLRGSDADADQAFVLDLSKKAGFTFFTADFDTLSYAKKNAISVEMSARELRYNFFEEVMRKEKIDVCALAHHADDQAETVFINLLRGTGIKGLRGMEADNSRYIRPLLFARRSEIELYAKEQKISFKTDYTNAQDDYLRNRIRHHLIPAFEELNPQAVPHISRMTESLQRTESVIETWYKQNSLELVEKTENGKEFISKTKIKKWKSSKNEDVLLCFFEMYLKERNFSIEQIDQILSNLRFGESNKVFENRDGKPVLQRTAKGWYYDR